MGSETNFWTTLKNKLRSDWEPERVENCVATGTPDLYYTLKKSGKMGWIELKYIPEIPKRETTIVNIEHYTPQQRNWIMRHGSIGATVFLFLQIEKTYILFNWRQAQMVGYLTYNQMLDQSINYWRPMIDRRELLSIL